MKNNIKCDFKPVSNSWVAIHPKPKGVIQFIGGAFFGTFPTIFYHYFLKQLYASGYTVIALPFRFTFNHWSVAISLVKEQYVLRREIIKEAVSLGYEYDIYLKENNFFWIGHSLGCKYIALLEFLSGEWQQVLQNLDLCEVSNSYYTNVIDNIESLSLDLDLEKRRTEIVTEAYIGKKPEIINLFIKGQPSLLIAPDISNTQSAIPIPFIAKLIDNYGFGVKPNLKQTRCLITRSELFKLIALICFKQDTIAQSTCTWLIEQLYTKRKPQELSTFTQQLNGKHLEPIGIKIDKYIIDFNPFDKFVEPIKNRKTEVVAAQLLEKLRQKQKEIDLIEAKKN